MKLNIISKVNSDLCVFQSRIVKGWLPSVFPHPPQLPGFIENRARRNKIEYLNQFRLKLWGQFMLLCEQAFRIPIMHCHYGIQYCLYIVNVLTKNRTPSTQLAGFHFWLSWQSFLLRSCHYSDHLHVFWASGIFSGSAATTTNPAASRFTTWITASSVSK